MPAPPEQPLGSHGSPASLRTQLEKPGNEGDDEPHPSDADEEGNDKSKKDKKKKGKEKKKEKSPKRGRSRERRKKRSPSPSPSSPSSSSGSDSSNDSSSESSRLARIIRKELKKQQISGKRNPDLETYEVTYIVRRPNFNAYRNQASPKEMLPNYNRPRFDWRKFHPETEGYGNTRWMVVEGIQMPEDQCPTCRRTYTHGTMSCTTCGTFLNNASDLCKAAAHPDRGDRNRSWNRSHDGHGSGGQVAGNRSEEDAGGDAWP